MERYNVEDQGIGAIYGGTKQLGADHFLVTFRDRKYGLYFWVKAHATQRRGDSSYFTWDDVKRVSLRPVEDNESCDPLFIDWIRAALFLPSPDEYDQYMQPGEDGSYLVDDARLDEFIDNHREPILGYLPRPGRPGELNERLINNYLPNKKRNALLKARQVLKKFLPGIPKIGAPIGNKNHEMKLPDEVIEQARKKTYKNDGISFRSLDFFASDVRHSPKTIRKALKRREDQDSQD